MSDFEGGLDLEDLGENESDCDDVATDDYNSSDED